MGCRIYDFGPHINYIGHIICWEYQDIIYSNGGVIHNPNITVHNCNGLSLMGIKGLHMQLWDVVFDIEIFDNHGCNSIMGSHMKSEVIFQDNSNQNLNYCGNELCIDIYYGVLYINKFEQFLEL